ncbi:LOW QUALITY PROTEIN: olfactory receptor 10R2 [Balaenoptera ricei]|uniref:LOW QUALITY PROTEIN: olfactory receptor 10R2 n=1 Tax=Balaenoptera ricei TaxID=2746895 RepID=UPI0028BF4A51|nr:LOW QUALITY PROTEIN: olfactory receptor 10R2 [Balaenoptera ricei]
MLKHRNQQPDEEIHRVVCLKQRLSLRLYKLQEEETAWCGLQALILAMNHAVAVMESGFPRHSACHTFLITASLRSWQKTSPLSLSDLLLGFSSLGEIQFVLFVVFLFLYLVILSDNVTIVSVILLDKSLHTPMYFFLSTLSTLETFYTFVVLPKMFINLLSVARTISFTCCAIQMFFFLGFAITNCLLLGVMGYGHYAAICQPLHYPILMSWQVCGKLGATCGIGGFLASLTVVYLVFSLPFCSAKKVNHYFCDISPVIHLACTNTDVHEFVIFICGVLVLVVPFLFIYVSYICILRTILKSPSAEGRQKTFSTCASHLTVVIIHCGCASYIYLRPTANYVSKKDRLVMVTYTIVTIIKPHGIQSQKQGCPSCY